jgi:outer membrane protein
VKSERLPSIGAFGDEGITGKSPGHLLPTYNVGVQLSLPVFDGLRRQARIEEQTLVSRELDVRRRDLRQQVAVEVRSAMLDLSSAREQVGATRERLRFAEQEVEQARERFRAGVSGNADVITAQLSLNAARTQLIDALTAYQTARIAFARAEGAVTELQ